jgi:hypothetical protein
MSIYAAYYVHVLIDGFSPQFFLYYKSNSSISLIYQTATIWQCNVVLSAQLFFLQPGKHSSWDIYWSRILGYLMEQDIGISYEAGYWDILWSRILGYHMKQDIEISYGAEYAPIPRMDFEYIWHDTSHNHPKTTTKISSFYLYILISCGCHRDILLHRLPTWKNTHSQI